MTRKARLAWIAGTALAVIALAPAASVYYESRAGEGCASCHEIREPVDFWRSSTHRNIPCTACHGDAATLDPDFHLNNLQRVKEHLRGDVPDQIRIRAVDIPAMLRRCQGCHRQEFADWAAGPHGVSYSKIFLDKEFNHKTLIMDDCLRCHGAFFPGGIQDLVTPVDRNGPWKFVDSSMADQPVIPCMSCHQLHREGLPRQRVEKLAVTSSTGQEIVRPSIALFDRRTMMHVSVARLSLPEMKEGDRTVRMSPDTRQAICYQCHAPTAGRQVHSGDDRTGLGVHEGISCLACHAKHGQTTRASCSGCHPRLSNCGLDVEKMDTTFFSSKSSHNIHFVKCADCHAKGVPRRKNTVAALRQE